jgi:hypothetical protein
MPLDKIERTSQREMDQEILYGIRGLQGMAPISEDMMVTYLQNTCHWKTTIGRVRDRLHYLVSAGLLDREVEWDGGEVTHYTITAPGMNVLDGVCPWPGWTPAG